MSSYTDRSQDSLYSNRYNKYPSTNWGRSQKKPESLRSQAYNTSNIAGGQFSQPLSDYNSRSPRGTFHQSSTPRMLPPGLPITKTMETLRGQGSRGEEEDQKILSGKIKGAKDAEELLYIARNPRQVIDRNTNPREVVLNAHHWAYLVTCLTNKVKEDPSKIEIAYEAVREMAKNLDFQNLTPEKISWITSALGSLKVKDREILKSLLSSILNALHNYHLEMGELYYILRFAPSLFTPDQVRELVLTVEDSISNGRLTTLNLEKKQLGALINLGVCYSYANKKDEMYQKLWEKIRNNFDTCTVTDLFHFLGGADTIYLPQSREFIKNVEARVKTELTEYYFLLAWKAFAYQSYCPSNLEEEATKLINAPTTYRNQWNKLSVFHGFAVLGDTGKRGAYKKWLEEIKEIPVERISTKHKVMILYVASILLELEDLDKQYFQRLLNSLPSWKNTAINNKNVYESSLILNLNSSIPDVHSQMMTSQIQDEVTKNLKEWLASHDKLKMLELNPEQRVCKDRHVDIVIDGFERLNWNQKPIAIELDGPRHFRRDDKTNRLGKTIRREKLLGRLGYELWEFDLRKGYLAVEEEIKGKFQELIEKHVSSSVPVEDPLPNTHESIVINPKALKPVSYTQLFCKYLAPVSVIACAGVWYVATQLNLKNG